MNAKRVTRWLLSALVAAIALVIWPVTLVVVGVILAFLILTLVFAVADWAFEWQLGIAEEWVDTWRMIRGRA